MSARRAMSACRSIRQASGSSANPTTVYPCYDDTDDPDGDLGFEQHEWGKHGVCAGVADADDYFTQLCAIAAGPLAAMRAGLAASSVRLLRRVTHAWAGWCASYGVRRRAALYGPRAERSVPALTRSTPASRTGSSLWPVRAWTRGGGRLVPSSRLKLGRSGRRSARAAPSTPSSRSR